MRHLCPTLRPVISRVNFSVSVALRLSEKENAVPIGGRARVPLVALELRCALRLPSRHTACDWRSLEIVKAQGLRLVAFPAVGTGVAHFPMDECARIMLEEVAAHGRGTTSVTQVRFVLFGSEAEAAFRREADRQLSAEKTREEDRGKKRQRHE